MKTSLNSFAIFIAQTVKVSIFLRKLITFVWHITGIFCTYWLAFQLRFDGAVPLYMQVTFWHTLPVLLVVCFLVFHPFRLHSGLWTYFSIDDLVRVGAAIFTAILITAFIVFAARGWTFEGVPRSVFVLEFMLLGLWVAGGRLILRYIKSYRHPWEADARGSADRIVLVGKLRDADLVIRSSREAGCGTVVAIVSNEKADEGTYFHGLRVTHTSLDEIAPVVLASKANCVLTLPPFNRPQEIRRIVDSCSGINTPCQFRTLPSLTDLTSGQFSASSIRDVAIEDLMARDTAQLDRKEVRKYLKGKKIMITGAGGSIGLELCHQIASYEPETILLFESSEYALYTAEKDIRARYPNLTVIPFAGDVRHPEEINAAIDKAGFIDVIYHAAAYKHVPLMEQNVAAAFRTNVLGTNRLAQVAIDRHVDRFVMISSDKAVRPTSVMGATKRLAERVISERPSNGTTFVSVRFGNVLESSGSVVPLFKEQIRKGGPVTVTSPDVRRFFMTVHEAVDLVLLAGTVGRNGEIMVLEMGDAVNIADMAKRLIELSGLIPGKDIQIEFTGLRPGEKEYEEVMTEDEDVVKTEHDAIWVFRKKTSAGKPEALDLKQLENMVLNNDVPGLLAIIPKFIPESHFKAPQKDCIS
ncbi:MAG: polysaccharide biosynthesis protein [Methanothrix sp.]|nr:MAG: polysaccharide biosynthesis protein [Methanothrix sp.]